MKSKRSNIICNKTQLELNEIFSKYLWKGNEQFDVFMGILNFKYCLNKQNKHGK